MAVRDDLIEALNTCIDRLIEGEAVETILMDYPALANDLRPMIEAGLLAPRARIPAAEVEAAETAGEAVIRQTIQDVFRSSFGWIGWILLLVAAGGIITITLLSAGENNSQIPAATAIDGMTATESPTISSTQTHTPSATASFTTTPTPLWANTATPTSDLSRILIIEGPIRAIEGNTITIYNITLSFTGNDPLLSAVRIGDVVHVEGIPAVGSIQIITINFVNVRVVTQENQVWRNDDCALPPPEWAQDEAGDWYDRCIPVAPPDRSSHGNNSENVGGNDDDDNDDDD